MEALKNHINSVIAQVEKMLAAGKDPSPKQLETYTTQVVQQVKNLTSRAPAHVKATLATPWTGDWDFDHNKPIPGSGFNVNRLTEILHDMSAMLAKQVSGGGAPAGQKPAMVQGALAKAAAPIPEKIVPKAACPTVTKSTGQETKVPEKQMKFDSSTKSWLQDLTGAPIKTRRDQAPPISEASKRMPTFEKKDVILGAIRQNRVTVISGDTGCGKSTLIPQLVCDAVNLIPDDKVVVCTQPRRVAAITLPEYVAKDRGQTLGDEVGYQIRFVNEFGEHTRLIYATTAIVLRRLHAEPDLESIGCLIVDEVHERDVYTDFLLLLVREAMLQGRMKHLKIVLMSATLKADDFADYFRKVNPQGALKPVYVPGRMFKVYDYYFEDACEWLSWCPPQKGGKGKGKKGKGKDKGKNRGGMDETNEYGAKEDDCYQVFQKIKKDMTATGRPGDDRVVEYSEKTISACALWKEREVYIDLIVDLIFYFHEQQPKGDGAILIFLPGWGDIAKLFLLLHSKNQKFKLITLHSLMTPEQQHEAFEPAPTGYRKIVLSTNIAEASVTIDDIVYVIDTGVRKERTYNAHTGVSTLQATMVSQANAIQRRGRAGRVQEGMVVHLFPSYMFKTFEEFPTPAMLTSSMEEVILQSKVIYGGSNSDIGRMLTSSMAQPSDAAIKSAVDSLKSMNCLTKEGELTALGRATAAIPVNPIHAKMLLFGGAFRCIKYAAIAAAFLSIKNPYQQNPGTKGGRDAGKDYFNRGFDSDHITTIQAYYEWREAEKKGNGDQFCELRGLSPEVLGMAHMMINQFINFMIDAGYDGKDVDTSEGGDIMEVSAFKKQSDEHYALLCAISAGFWPNACVLYSGGKNKASWYTNGNESISAFLGSVNADYMMTGKDGEEWMMYSDSMKMGMHNSVMDSSAVTSNYSLLFANGLVLDRSKNRPEVRFDKWYAYAAEDDLRQWKECLELRKEIMPSFKAAIEGRDLALFPESLVKRMIAFVKAPPLKLEHCEAVRSDIQHECKDKNKLSIFEWQFDDGPGPEDEDVDMS